MGTDTDLPLFSWQPPACELIPFPLDRRIGKIRDVAAKLLDKSTERHANFYRSQISDALTAHLSKLGLSPEEQSTQISVFFAKVQDEVARITYRGSRPGGAA
jgi:hypothetical protein